MATFTVTYTFTGEYHNEVEADNEADARAIVRAEMLDTPSDVRSIFVCDDDSLEAEEI